MMILDICYRSEIVHGVMNIHGRYVYAWAPTDEMFISPYNSKLSSGNTCMITMKYGGSLDSFILQDCVTGSTIISLLDPDNKSFKPQQGYF